MRRDVSFIDEDVKRWIEEEGPEDGLCLKRFRADITVSNLHKCKVGDVVEISESLYEITETGKRCFDECGLLKRLGKSCPLAGGAAFGKRIERDKV